MFYCSNALIVQLSREKAVLSPEAVMDSERDQVHPDFAVIELNKALPQPALWPVRLRTLVTS